MTGDDSCNRVLEGGQALERWSEKRTAGLTDGVLDGGRRC